MLYSIPPADKSEDFMTMTEAAETSVRTVPSAWRRDRTCGRILKLQANVLKSANSVIVSQGVQLRASIV
jgi:hypothetical protein